MSALTDLRVAQASTLSNMGLLLAAMEVDGLNAEKLAELDLNLTRDPDDENAQSLCPPATPLPASVDRDALFARLNGTNDAAAAAASAAVSFVLNDLFAPSRTVSSADSIPNASQRIPALRRSCSVSARTVSTRAYAQIFSSCAYGFAASNSQIFK